MFFLLGSIVVVVCVVVGFLRAGGNLLLLWHPTEIIIICDAALGAFMTSNPLKVVKRSFAGAIGLINPRDTTGRITSICSTAVRRAHEGAQGRHDD
jgi:flagellar motor component MotA